jgi:hypothetical protein
MQVTLDGCYLYLTLTREEGEPGQALLHLEASGHLGVAKPPWSYSRDVATAAVPLLRAALTNLEARAADPTAWPSREDELDPPTVDEPSASQITSVPPVGASQ